MNRLIFVGLLGLICQINGKMMLDKQAICFDDNLVYDYNLGSYKCPSYTFKYGRYENNLRDTSVSIYHNGTLIHNVTNENYQQKWVFDYNSPSGCNGVYTSIRLLYRCGENGKKQETTESLRFIMHTNRRNIKGLRTYLHTLFRYCASYNSMLIATSVLSFIAMILLL
jgi:hypothetical protein